MTRARRFIGAPGMTMLFRSIRVVKATMMVESLLRPRDFSRRLYYFSIMPLTRFSTENRPLISFSCWVMAMLHDEQLTKFYQWSYAQKLPEGCRI